jgi:hypothetical protein
MEIIVEGPDDRDPEEAEDYPPGRDWCARTDDVGHFAGAGDVLDAEDRIRAPLPRDVRERLEWDSEGGMLCVYGGEADIRLVAQVMRSLAPA